LKAKFSRLRGRRVTVRLRRGRPVQGTWVALIGANAEPDEVELMCTPGWSAGLMTFLPFSQRLGVSFYDDYSLKIDIDDIKAIEA
jgi:hypothetical protein